MSNPPDVILDIRVRVPHSAGHKGFHVTQAVGRWVDNITIEAIHPAIDRGKNDPHKFESGLKYTRLENGWRYDCPDGSTLYYFDQDNKPLRQGPTHPVTHDPELDGPLTNAERKAFVDQMFTGGPREVHEPEYGNPTTIMETLYAALSRRLEAVEQRVAGQIDGVSVSDRLDRLERQTSNYRASLGEVQMTLAKIEQRLADRDQSGLIADMAAKAGELVERVEGIERRSEGIVNRLLDRIETLEKQSGLTIDSLNLRSEELQRIDARLAKMAEEQAVDVAQAHQRMDSIPRYDTAIKMLEKRIAAIDGMGAEGYDVKRTIKGGWVNVYDSGGGHGVLCGKTMASISTCFPSKAAADAMAAAISKTDKMERIACIHIPDITEGEGL